MKTIDVPSPAAAGKIFDVAHPGKAKAEPTAKPVIVSNRPILKDPMVVDEETTGTEVADATKERSPIVTKIKLQPLSENTDELEEATPEKLTEEKLEPTQATEQAQPTAEPESAVPPDEEEAPEPEPASPEPSTGDTSESTTEDTPEQRDATAAGKEQEQKAAEQAAARQAELEGIIESKKYFVSINAVQKRRTAQTLLLLFLLAVILVAVGADLALDAGLLHIAGVHALTDFFNG